MNKITPKVEPLKLLAECWEDEEQSAWNIENNQVKQESRRCMSFSKRINHSINIWTPTNVLKFVILAA